MFYIIWQKYRDIVQRFKQLMCFCCGIFIVIGIVTLRNYLVERDFVLIAGHEGINFYLGNNPEADGLFHTPHFIDATQEGMFSDARAIAKIATKKDLKTSGVSHFWFTAALKFIRNNPRAYVKLLVKKILYLLSPLEQVHDQEYSFALEGVRVLKIMFLNLRLILPFALLGMVIEIRRFKEKLPLYLITITLPISIVFFFVTARYRIGVVPFLIIFAAAGIISLGDALKERKLVKALLLICLFALCYLTTSLIASFAEAKKKSQRDFLDFRTHLAKASIYEDRRDFIKARQELEAAGRLHPYDYRLIFMMGAVSFKMGDMKAAEEKFKETLRIFPLYADAYYNLGLIYNLQGRFAEAIGVLEKSAYLNAEDARLHFELGIAYRETGERERARREFEIALEKTNRWRTEDRARIEKEISDLIKNR